MDCTEEGCPEDSECSEDCQANCGDFGECVWGYTMGVMMMVAEDECSDYDADFGCMNCMEGCEACTEDGCPETCSDECQENCADFGSCVEDFFGAMEDTVETKFLAKHYK